MIGRMTRMNSCLKTPSAFEPASVPLVMSGIRDQNQPHHFVEDLEHQDRQHFERAEDPQPGERRERRQDAPDDRFARIPRTLVGDDIRPRLPAKREKHQPEDEPQQVDMDAQHALVAGVARKDRQADASSWLALRRLGREALWPGVPRQGRASAGRAEPADAVSDAQTTAIDRARERLTTLKVRL